MYEENRNQGFDGNERPDEHKVEESTSNFIMKDANGETPDEFKTQTVANNQGQENQTSYHVTEKQGLEKSDQQQTYNTIGANIQNPNESRQQAYGPTGNNYSSYSQIGNQNQPNSQQNRNQGQYQGQPQPYMGNGYQMGPQPSANGPMNHGDAVHSFTGPFQNGSSYQQMPGQDISGNGKDSKKKQKRRGMMSKVAGITAAALLFGVISGGTMVGVNMAADAMKKETYPEVSQAETVAPSEATELPAGNNINTRGANNAVVMDVSSIVEKAMPSIVAITNTMLYQSSTPWFGRGQTYEIPSSGSGIIMGQNDEELLIVTNNHVVENATSLSVAFVDSTSVEATIKGMDADADLAVIAVPLKDIPEATFSQISIATLGNSDELKVGNGVIAIGNALGFGQSITVGFVSALDREVTTDGTTTRNLLQTDAAINPGNSGGALLNMKGEVIGINAAKYSSTEVEGIGYAIPISKAEDIINSLMTKRTRNNIVEEGKEGYLGIQGLTVDDSMARQLGMPSGVFVSGIVEGGAASKTDLREKDIITKFDDQTVRSMASLQELLKYYKEGETVNLTVQSLKDGEYVERTIEITLGGKSTLSETNKADGGK